MYCKFCGKPLKDNARFCGLCGKEQEIPFDRISKDEDLRKSVTRAEIYTIISLIIEVTIIVLSFTKVFRIEMGNAAISQSLMPQGIEINLFDFFAIADILSGLSSSIHSGINSTIIDVLCGLSIILISAIGVCIIYFLHVNRYGGPLYKKYSVIPAAIFGALSIVILIIFSANMGNAGKALPSPSLNAIFILIGIQYALNKICSFEETEVDEDNEDEEDEDEDEDEEDDEDDKDDENENEEDNQDDEYEDNKETDEPSVKTDFWGRQIW